MRTESGRLLSHILIREAMASTSATCSSLPASHDTRAALFASREGETRKIPSDLWPATRVADLWSQRQETEEEHGG